MLPGVRACPGGAAHAHRSAAGTATTECGWFLDQEGRVGSLQPGWHADLIVLSDDYFKVPDAAIKDIRSNLTVVDGRIVHADGAFKHVKK